MVRIDQSMTLRHLLAGNCTCGIRVRGCSCKETRVSRIAPQAMMNVPKHRNIQLKGRSRLLRTKYSNVKGIEVYARAIRLSEMTCSRTSDEGSAVF
jgi:hypothetical protein